jgi:hypothetical protein
MTNKIKTRNMMKTRTLLIGLLGFFVMMSCDREPPVLPAETQEGLNTFGCLVNGELVIHIPRAGWPRNEGAFGTYLEDADYFVLMAQTQYVSHNISLFITQPKVGTFTIDSVIFYPNDVSVQHYYMARNTGQIRLTRFDQQIASGTFEFEANGYDKQTHAPVPNRKIHVNKGRFDVQLRDQQW